jgi:hypothetical protein
MELTEDEVHQQQEARGPAKKRAISNVSQVRSFYLACLKDIYATNVHVTGFQELVIPAAVNMPQSDAKPSIGPSPFSTDSGLHPIITSRNKNMLPFALDSVNLDGVDLRTNRKTW